MDDVQIITSQESYQAKSSKWKVILIIFVLILSTAAISTLSYFLGTKFSTDSATAENQISPTQSPPPTEPKNTNTPTPKISGKPSPTSKLTQTPTPTPTPAPILKSKILSSVAELDGFMSSNGGGINSLEIRAGRNSSLVTRGFVSFDIGNIPSGAEIQSATIRLYQAKIIGNPYSAGDNLKIDHLTYGDALDSTDYAMPALSTSFASLSTSEKVGWKEADVTERLKNDVANARPVSQFRIHFQNEVTGGDTAGDFVYFEAKENSLGTGNTPQLVVKYY